MDAGYHVFEIFERRMPGEPFVHVGDIEAPDPQAALFFAKEHMLRRERVTALWVVDRRHIHETAWPSDVLNSGSLKRYRRTPGRTGRSSESGSSPAPTSEGSPS